MLVMLIIVSIVPSFLGKISLHIFNFDCIDQLYILIFDCACSYFYNVSKENPKIVTTRILTLSIIDFDYWFDRIDV